MTSTPSPAPEGEMKLLPCEPTDEMLRAAISELDRLYRGDGGWIGTEAAREQALRTWRAMLSAARPTPIAEGDKELRYTASARSNDAVVIDNDRREIFCVIPESIVWGGVDMALARAKDIAEMFNRAADRLEQLSGK